MARITAYETTDGQIFKDRKQYLEHARNLVAGARIKALIEAQVSDAAIAQSVAAFYTRNVGALRDLVNSKDISIDGSTDGSADDDASDTPAPVIEAQPVSESQTVAPVEIPAGTAGPAEEI